MSSYESKELSSKGKVTDELKSYLKAMIDKVEETETKEDAKDFLEDLPSIERINELRRELQEKQQEENQGRLDKGELRSISAKLRPEGLGSYEEDNPGAAGSGEPIPSIKAFKVIKVELEEDEPEGGTKITLAMIATVILTIVTQLLFMKCKKRNNPVETVNTEREQVPEESSEEDEFEIISNNEEVNEAMTSNQEPQPEQTVEMINQTEEGRKEMTPPNPIQEGEEEGRKI
jgi:hypothetical protein